MSPEVFKALKNYLRQADATMCAESWKEKDIFDFMLHINENGYQALDWTLHEAIIELLANYINEYQNLDDPFRLLDAFYDSKEEGKPLPDGLSFDNPEDLKRERFHRVRIEDFDAFANWLEVRFVETKLCHSSR